MSSVRHAKNNISRSLLCNLWSDEKSPFVYRNYSPGMHGDKPKMKTPYGMQLRAKQMLRFYYNMKEKQFRKFFENARKQKGDTGENLMKMLETRLDAVVYRSGFAATVFSSMQLIGHGHVMVNGKVVNIRSALIQEGDVISFTAKAQEFGVVKEAFEKLNKTISNVPDYLTVNLEDKKVTLNRIPTFKEIPFGVEMKPSLVIELYSK